MSGKLHPGSFLSSGEMNMPIFALGTWKTTDEEIDVALNAAVDAGCRHIDSAYGYSNETGIGKSLKKMFENGKVTREEIFICTKLPAVGHRFEDVEPFLNKSLDALQLDYIDLYVAGTMGFQKKGDEINPKDENGKLLVDFSTDIISIWKAMEEQVKAGRSRHIGLCIANLSQLQRILDACEIRPANVTLELHPYFQQKEVVSFCKKNNIAVSCYAPFGAPGVIFTIGNLEEGQLNVYPTKDPVIIEIAKKYKKIPTQVILKFWIEKGVAVVLRSAKPNRIKQHLDIFDFELTKEECEKISALDRGEEARVFGSPNGLFSEFRNHPEFINKS